MKITTHPYRVKFSEPFRSAKGEYRERSGYLVSCEDVRNRGINKIRGICGWGEIAPFPGFSKEMDHEVRAGIIVASAVLDSFPTPDTPESLSEVLYELDNTLETIPPSVAFGIELAILSLCEKRVGVPLPVMLGDEEGWRLVPVNGIIDPDSPHFLSRLSELRSKGISCFKIKLISDIKHKDSKNSKDLIDERVARIERIRSELTNHESLRIDCNQHLRMDEVLELIYRIGTQNIEYLEDPLIPQDLDHLSTLTDKLSVPIALDESLSYLDTNSFLKQRASHHVFVLKPTVIGGIRKTIEKGRDIIKNGGKVVITSTLEWSHGLRGVYLTASCLAGDKLLPSGLLTNDLFTPEGARFTFEQGAVMGIDVGDVPPINFQSAR